MIVMTKAGITLKRKTSLSIVKLSLTIVLSAAGMWLLYFCFEGFILDYFNNKAYQAVYLPTRGYSKELKLSAFEYEDIQKEYGIPTSIVREQSAINPDVMLVCNEYPGVSVHYTEVTESSGVRTYNLCLISITARRIPFRTAQYRDRKLARASAFCVSARSED